MYFCIPLARIPCIDYLLPNREISTRQEVGVINVKYQCHKANRTPNVNQKSSLAVEIVVPSGLIILPWCLLRTWLFHDSNV